MGNVKHTAIVSDTREILGHFYGDATPRELAKWSIKLAKEFKVSISKVLVVKGIGR